MGLGRERGKGSLGRARASTPEKGEYEESASSGWETKNRVRRGEGRRIARKENLTLEDAEKKIILLNVWRERHKERRLRRKENTFY